MGNREFLGKSDEMPRGRLFDGLPSYPGSGNNTPCHFVLHENQDKLWLGGSIGSSTYLTFITLPGIPI